MDFHTCQRRFTSELDIFKNNDFENLLEGMNVEDGLSAQDNETFLIASMAFLQQHAKRKLGMINEYNSEPEIENKKFKSTYSNMLLFETPRGNVKERIYLKLKDHEKFDDLLKSETCIAPASVLSQEQILPKAKNPTKLSKLFRSRSTTVTSKRSIFNMFRQRNKEKRSEIRIFHDDSSSDLRNRNDWTWEIKQKCQQLSNTEEQKQKQLQYVKDIDNDRNHLLIKASIHRKLRAKPTKSAASMDKFSWDNSQSEKSGDDESVIVIEKLPNLSIKGGHSNFNLQYELPNKKGKNTKEKRKKLSRPLSKISVCFEEDTESDADTLRKEKCRNRSAAFKIVGQPLVETESKISFSNFSDELKAHLSPEVLQDIISEMIICLEDAPSNKSLHATLSNQH